MSVEADQTGTQEPPDTQHPGGGRRWFLRSAGLGAAVAGVALVSPAAAEATTAKIKRVHKYLPLKWTYNPRTRVTVVTKARLVTVTARFVGARIYEKDRRGVWVQVPYVWSARHRAMVYSRALHLALIAAARPKPVPKPAPKPVPKPLPPPAPPVTPPPPPPNLPLPGGTVAATASSPTPTPYVSSSMAWHLARRASFGPTLGIISAIESQGPTAWLDQQLEPAGIDDAVVEAYVARLPHINDSIMDTTAALNAPNSTFGSWNAYMNVASAQVARALWSNRHLLTVMDDFWSNHFNVWVFKDGTAPSRADYAKLLRVNAFGKFSDLLYKVITHPSMLVYLDNAESDKDHPNENLGRELLELHTVGIGAGYTEDEVLDSARLLTGLSISDTTGEFEYKPGMHWTDPAHPITVLGFTEPNIATDWTSVNAALTRYLDYLAHHNATAQRLCRQLAVRFVSDDPPQSLIDSLVAVYVQYDTQISAVLKALFTSPEFAASAGAKLQRPFERIAATVRILGYGPDATGTEAALDIWQWADQSGNAPLNWEPPNGYPDVAAAWTSTAATLGAWNSRINIVAKWWPATMTNQEIKASVTPPILPATYDELVTVIGHRLFGLEITPAHRSAVLTFLGVAGTDLLAAREDSVGALDWKLAAWVSILLDSPYGTRR